MFFSGKYFPSKHNLKKINIQFRKINQGPTTQQPIFQTQLSLIPFVSTTFSNNRHVLQILSLTLSNISISNFILTPIKNKNHNPYYIPSPFCWVSRHFFPWQRLQSSHFGLGRCIFYSLILTNYSFLE
jgi:hypothetical protein